ncbi:hypothetical protein GCM10008934_30800 [Virgibacillus salarius]
MIIRSEKKQIYPKSTTSRIRRGQIDIGSITLDNTLKLYEFYQNHKNEIKLHPTKNSDFLLTEPTKIVIKP